MNDDEYNKVYASLDVNCIHCFNIEDNMLIPGKLKLRHKFITFTYQKYDESKQDFVQEQITIQPEFISVIYSQKSSLSIYDFLLSLSSDKIEHVLNCAHLVKSGRQIQTLDLEQVKLFASSTAEILKFCDSSSTVVLQTYQNLKFRFVTQFAIEVVEHLKLFLNIREVVTSGSEDFDYTVIREEKQKTSNNLIIRNAVTFQKKVSQTKKILKGLEQINHLKELKQKEILMFEKQKLYQSFNKLTNFSQQNLTPLSQCGTHLPDILVPTDDPLGFDIAIVLRINFKQSCTLTDHFLGRKSQILSDQYLNQLYNILPKMLSQFKMLVQYTSAFDGRHLQNLYNSYRFQRTDITNKEMYNNHLDLGKLKLSQTQIIIIRANDQVFGVIFTGQLASIQGGLNYGSSIFNLQSGHKWSAVNEYILKRCDRLVVGVSGSAIVLQNDLMAVQTSSSESYDSPELFQGNRYGMFVQARVQCVELIRFVIE
ncbi:TLD_family protein [Hexamita inflata]|uniref:Oxidation resistance protein 1 n=1 Tax=Hexamita inflata TaxID=28002 RepID=A0AA86QD14_9EUKA|nr:TLD family protein [Hexamita inflata]